MYSLFVRLEDGTSKFLGSAPGSPFWTEMVYLANEMYGIDNVYYTFELANGR